MKTLRLFLLGGVLVGFLLQSSAQAQNYGVKRGARRPPVQPNAASTNASPQQVKAPQQPPPAPIIVTQVVFRVVAAPVDPEKAKAAKEELVRKTVEFQKMRAGEGSESAQYELGLRYLKGDGVEKDEAMGRKFLAESAKNEYGPAVKKLEDLDRQAKATEAK